MFFRPMVRPRVAITSGMTPWRISGSTTRTLKPNLASQGESMTVHEPVAEPSNPLGLDGIEFIEYATSQPQEFGTLLRKMGFSAVARHRSREVLLYRQGSMNLIVNAHPDALPGLSSPGSTPALAAIALRVRDAAYAHRRALELGAWDIPTRASAMELNIPGIHGVGDILVDRTADWLDFYRSLFGFSVLPQGQYFGILPRGTLLESPCRKFYLQLIEPPPGSEEIRWDEALVRLGLGARDVPAATRALQERGIAFVERGPVQPSQKGALTQAYLGGVNFELVVSHLKP